MNDFKTPGVYVQEIQKFPPSIAAVETAIPVFIGYTEKALDERGDDLLKKPKRIDSLLQYERFFGKGHPESGISVALKEANGALTEIKVEVSTRSPYLMHYSMQLFYANGGGECYIVSVGDYSTGTVSQVDLLSGLASSDKVDEITLILFPEAQSLGAESDFYGLYNAALKSCADLQDRFSIIDVWLDPTLNIESDSHITTLRGSALGTTVDILKYGAVYYPNLDTTLDLYYGEGSSGDASVAITVASGDPGLAGDLSQLKSTNNAFYFQVKDAIRRYSLRMPPSSGMAGIYARVDDSRGVWKAPANINMSFVEKPAIKITDKDQEKLNVDVNAGKSVNAIRTFTGRGPAIVWGARTLAGNDNEWRYVSVRRFFNMVEESTKKATFQFVFEPNDINTWTRVKSMIENFLVLQWKAGALQGVTPEQAFYVRVGLNETMTEQDIWEGRMIVEIGMAVVRPAEFIILKFSHKMLSES